jgi:hypothetical protein
MDRFTTHWKNHRDPAAVAWAQSHKINFTTHLWLQSYYIHEENNIRKIKVVPIEVEIAGKTNMAVLRQENLLSDQETRDKHANDAELDCGTALGTDWATATRGEKLRTCAVYKKLYEREIEKFEARIEFLLQRQKELGDGVPKKSNDKMEGKVVEASSDLETMNSCLDQSAWLQRKVEDETVRGWEWKSGIQEQIGLWDALMEMETWMGKWSTESLEKGKKDLESVEDEESSSTLPE